MSTTDLIVVLGFDFNRYLSGVGPGSKQRCIRAVELVYKLREQKRKPLVYVSPGYSPSLTHVGQRESMASMMARFLRRRLSADEVHVGNETWGSRAELLEAARYAARELGDVPGACVYVVSSWYHIPRLWLLAQWISVWNHCPWRWRFAASGGGMKAAMRELYKIPAEILLCLVSWWPRIDDPQRQRNMA